MKKLPIGIQDFAKLRNEDYLYIDKTKHIFDLLDNSYYFLSRPRRFGKSLLVSTLRELFLGNKALFKGLWIEDKIEWKQYPVIHLSFAKGDYKDIGLKKYLLENIYQTAKKYGLTLKHDTLGFALAELIKTLHKQHQAQVVLLIDEYDKPIIDFLGKDEIHIAKENRDIMKEFYSPIKDLDPHLRFFFLTGVSKFSKVSVFSELNNLNDITIDENFATLTGYTHKELTHYFAPHITHFAEKKKLSEQEVLDNLRLWYNGYLWAGEERLYNPFSILNSLQKMSFYNFWFETGIPTFLTKLMAEGGYYDVSEIETDLMSLGSFDIERIDPIVVLFQTGFLTLKENTMEDIYRLGYPNREVRNTMVKLLLREYAHITGTEENNLVVNIKRSFDRHDLESFFEYLHALFAKIPYQIFEEKKESYYHSIIFLLFTLLGYYSDAEVSTSRGRIDAVVRTVSHIYILEFKVNDTAENALKQIKEKGYAEKYSIEGRQTVLIGVACNQKMIEEYLVEEL